MKEGKSLFCSVAALLAICFAAGLLGVSLVEALTRCLLPQYSPEGMISFYNDPNGVPLAKKGFRGRQWKNTGDYDVAVKINAYGFRDPKDIKESGEDSIFVVGDSYCFGWGVEEKERFSNLLENTLGVSVYNISIPTDFYGYQRLIDYAHSKGGKIRNLIIGVCMENDLSLYDAEDPMACYRKQGKNGGDFLPSLLGLKEFLSSRSAAYNFFSYRIHHTGDLKSWLASVGIVADPLSRNLKPPFDQKVIDSSAQYLAAMSRPYNTLIMIVPARQLWVGANTSGWNHVHRGFVSLLREMKLNVVDLKSCFETGSNPLQYHFENDGHWNSIGHQRAAEALVSFMREGGPDWARFAK